MPQNPNQPFQEYLTAPLKPQTPNPTGFESPSTAALLIGKNLLDGFRQGRLQRAAEAERQNERSQRSAETALKYLDSLKDVDPEVIAPYKNKLMNQYLQMIGSQKETSKDTGHPLTDFFKNAAINMSGGPMPKQKGPVIDPSLINEAMMAAVDPNNSKYNRMAKANANISSLLESTGFNDQRTIMSDSRFIPLVGEVRRLANNPDLIPESIKSRAADPYGARIENFRMLGLKGLENGPAKSSGNIETDFHGLLKYIEQADALKIVHGQVKPTKGNPVNVNIPGSDRPVVANWFSGVAGYKDGFYANGQHLEGAALAAPVNPNAQIQIIASNEGPGQPTQFNAFNKVTGDVKPTTLVKHDPPQLRVLTNQNQVTGTVTQHGQYFTPPNATKVPTSAPIPVAPAQALPPMANVVPPQVPTAQGPPQSDIRQNATPPAVNAVPPQAAPVPQVRPTQAVPPQATPIQQTATHGNVMKAGLDPAFITMHTESARKGLISEEDLKSLSGPHFQIMANNLAKAGVFLPNKKQQDGLNSVGQMSIVLPLYRELASLLPNEKNQTLQFSKGLIVDKAGAWLNPKVKELVVAINTQLTNLSKGIGGEVRPTDYDARQMMGWAPDATYNLELNTKRLKRFEKVLVDHFKTYSGSASEDQIKQMVKARPKELHSLFGVSDKPVNPYRNQAK